jgi:hypothetical protein
MANHKVPQDVETADKLIGFLSLKQFLFVLGGAGLSFLAFQFAKASIILAIPFLPFIFVMLVLGLYQRKDQPVEVFLAAWLKYKISPKARIWNQEGYEHRVIVTAPKKEVIDYSKGLTTQDVYNNFSGLGSKLDTRGWSTKGVSSATATDLGVQDSERLMSIESINELKKKYRPEAEPPQDVFDANNSPVATMVEVDVDKSAQAQPARAMEILSHTAPTQVETHAAPQLQPQQATQVETLSTAEIPISSVSSQAGQTINLEQGAEFSLH